MIMEYNQNIFKEILILYKAAEYHQTHGSYGGLISHSAKPKKQGYKISTKETND